MWPIRIERFIETIIARLGAIQNAIQEKNSATHNTQEGTYVKWSDIPRITTSILDLNKKDQTSAADREQAHGEQREIIASQNRTAIWTRNAAIAAMFYGLIALVQGGLMWRTYVEVQKQTKAARRAAYAACKAAQIARNSLIASEQSQTDSHAAMVAATDQAFAEIQSEAGRLVVSVDSRQDAVVERDKPLGVPYVVENFGKTPIKNVKIFAYAEYVQVFDDLTVVPSTVKRALFKLSLLVPDIPTPEEGLIVHVRDREGKLRHPTSDEVDAFKKGEADLLFLGHSSYDDSFGVSHWSYFCTPVHIYQFGVLSKGAHPKCYAYNREDSNSLIRPTVAIATTGPGIEEIPCPAPEN